MNTTVLIVMKVKHYMAGIFLLIAGFILLLNSDSMNAFLAKWKKY